MNSVIIPVKNEAVGIIKTLDNCAKINVHLIITVLNGCTDNSKDLILGHPLQKKIKVIEFPQPLGVDVPRAIGAAYAYKMGSEGFLFLDGDMQGDISANLQDLLIAINLKKTDMALTNCYPFITLRSSIANTVLLYRERLNRSLGLLATLGLANPSHGPHAISRNLLNLIPWNALAIPPLSLAMAAAQKLKIQVATSVPHSLLLSPLRDEEHSTLIAETIIGDCIQALAFIHGQPFTRKEKGILYLGYHPQRNFTLLEEYIRELGLE